ncbi:hypothetical protein [Comamonas sp. UBA7528]|uniref:hypothetical protein n=1 Tax=Comamonas sp. UBA7528 TaxID=1946391 RepID=UPI0025BEE005|nr:hypothetical protein [Comamonas sp. UBA7528]
MSSVNSNSPTLNECTVLGANGFPFSVGSKLNLGFDEQGVHCASSTRTASVNYSELAELNISGPGSVSTGGGFIGGGFGAEGALEGIAIAGVLNLLTSKTTVHTFLTLITNFGELHLHYGGLEPGALRIALAHVFVKLRRLDPVWLESRLAILRAQREAGQISETEFSSATKRLLVSSDWKDPVMEAVELRKLHQTALENGPKGECPNCNAIIPFLSESCPKCKAAFGVGSTWQVTPV